MFFLKEENEKKVAHFPERQCFELKIWQFREDCPSLVIQWVESTTQLLNSFFCWRCNLYAKIRELWIYVYLTTSYPPTLTLLHSAYHKCDKIKFSVPLYFVTNLSMVAFKNHNSARIYSSQQQTLYILSILIPFGNKADTRCKRMRMIWGSKQWLEDKEISLPWINHLGQMY